MDDKFSELTWFESDIDLGIGLSKLKQTIQSRFDTYDKKNGHWLGLQKKLLFQIFFCVSS